MPAGPYGLIGAVEGISYLGTTLLVGYSIYTKIKSGNGLPAGPYGFLGVAEGLAYAALLAGIVVLISQVVNLATFRMLCLWRMECVSDYKINTYLINWCHH